MAKNYKARKEDFVSNLSGGDILEINWVTLVAPAAVLLWSALQSRQSFFKPYGPAALATDLLLNVGAILFATTIYSSSPLLLNLLLISPAILLCFLPKSSRSQRAKPQIPRDANGSPIKPPANELDPFPVRPFLTTYRGAMMIITCLAILAVDFRIFPRRFAKVENWGTSLMDLGVGSFVFSAGVVSARSVLKESVASNASTHSLLHRLAASTWHSLPLFILGLIRLYSVKGLDYAEHVTEYGLHWNFFFTLSFLPPFVELFHSLAATIIPSYYILSLLLSIAYQTILSTTSLQAYILISSRDPTSLLSQNREGIFSFIGYLAIFLSGRGTGLVAIPAGGSKRSLLVRLLLTSLAWTLVFLLSSTYFFGLGLRVPVSRRLANAPYTFWVSAFNTAQLFLFCLIETVFFPSLRSPAPKHVEDQRTNFTTSRIMRAFNKNGLVVFLVANLLTGAVNLGVDTLGMGAKGAMGVLIGYAVLVTGIAVGLDKYGIKLKL